MRSIEKGSVPDASRYNFTILKLAFEFCKITRSDDGGDYHLNFFFAKFGIASYSSFINASFLA
ncbi:hypothetical protein SAMN05216269_1051 [Flavobacterium xinjiangense]|uniref:Uncharacterized protein n=1 Tax=Flavobacterium xinjiangense TaxID=178356 RepID=A0A1M7JK06_9FLAO|nr:hypothetical protein SAMN05216269_1051 [Flavobacterium xinjiangense]